jgi:hypothetical protein
VYSVIGAQWNLTHGTTLPMSGDAQRTALLLRSGCGGVTVIADKMLTQRQNDDSQFVNELPPLHHRPTGFSAPPVPWKTAPGLANRMSDYRACFD